MLYSCVGASCGINNCNSEAYDYGKQPSCITNRFSSLDESLKPSKILLDPLPSPPTASNPDQRVIGRIKRPALKLYLRLLASSDVLDRSDEAVSGFSSSVDRNWKKAHAKPRARRLGDRIPAPPKKPAFHHSPKAEDGKKEKKPEISFNDMLELGISESVRQSFLEHRLSLADFRPFDAPFVPQMLKILVNSIETDCHASDWEPIFNSFPALRESSDLHACLMIQNWNHSIHLRRQIESLTLPAKIMTLRSLLSAFKQKPLHFNRKMLKEVIERPLFDLFLRPNPKLKSIVRHTALPCNRTAMDSLAFMMFHLQHAWEYASNPLTAKLRLAKLYGPLLVSFSERPVVVDQDPSDYKTEEAAILEVVLEVCNSQFWDNLSMLRLHSAFTSKTQLERSRGHSKNLKNQASVIYAMLDLEEEDESEREKSNSDMSLYENERWFSYLFPPSEVVSKEEIPEELPPV